MLPFLDRLKTWWTTADSKQKVVTLGGIGALLLVLLGTAFVATRPRYDVLYDNLAEADRGKIVDGLTALGIASKIDRPGIVEIPADKIPEARMKLVGSGAAPKGPGHWPTPTLPELSPFTPPDVQRRALDEITQGRIMETLQIMEGVASATVLITHPNSSLFVKDKERPTASVTIVESAEGGLTSKQGRVIASLVSSAVDGMTIADVFVSSNTLGILWDGKKGETFENKSELDAQVGRQWESKLQPRLDAMFGLGNTQVIAVADVDTTIKTIDSQQAIASDVHTSTYLKKENMENGVAGPGGVAGAFSNTSDRSVSAPPANLGKGAKYTGVEKVTNAVPGSLHTTQEGGSGDLKGLTVTVVANTDKIADPLPIEKIVDGVMGGKIKRDEQGKPEPNQPFAATVVPAKFDGSASAAAAKAADAAAGQQRMQQILSLLPIGAILIVALLVAKQVGKISKAVLPAPVVADATLAEGEPSFFELENAEALPAPAEGVEVTEISEENPLMGLETIKDRVDLPLESLKQMAAERPEMVATLIKSVMLGEKG